MAAEILSSYGITPLVIAEPAPTPAISYAVIQSKADGAINFTASHNPPEYNGIKFSTPDGAPALPEVTKAIEAEIAAFDPNPQTPRASKSRVSAGHSIRAECISRACAKSSISSDQEIRHQDCLRSRCGARPAAIPTRFCATPALPWPPSTTPATCSSAATLPSPTIICSKTCASKMREIGAAHRHCDRWRCRSLRHCRRGWHIPPAQLHHCAALRLPG